MEEEYKNNNYQPLNESSLVKKQKTDWLRLWVAVGIGMMLGAMGFGLIVQAGITEQFIPNHIYDQKLNESFINGTLVGGEYTIAIITNEIIKCNTLPISYAGYNYTLVAIECLNLSKE